MLFALTAVHDWDVWQMNFATAFLYPTIDRDIYMELPEGYGIAGQQDYRRRYVCKLNKALYGSKQAPRTWYSDIDASLVNNLRFQRSIYDANLYMLPGHSLFLLLWVNDILIFAPPPSASSAVLK